MAEIHEAVVVYDYEKTQDDELDLKVGQVIQAVVQADEGWCEGTLNGQRGMFPDNFVKLRPVTKSAPPPSAPPTSAPPPSTPPPSAPPTSAPPPSATPPVDDSVLRGGGRAIKNRRAKVAFSYAAENSDELTLEPGQLVEILAEEEEGWFKGKLNGKVGVFPSNFLESVPEESPQDEPDTVADTRVEETPVTKPPAGSGTFGPKLFPSINPSEARLKLKHAKPSPPSQPEKKPLPPPVPAPVAAKQPDKPPEKQKPLEQAKVTYPYLGENGDELTIEVDDIVEIVNKDSGQEGWWKVKLNDRVGLIPDNFVTLQPATGSPHPKSTHSNKPPPPLPSDGRPPPPTQPNREVPIKPLPPSSGSLSSRKPHPNHMAHPPLSTEPKPHPILPVKEESSHHNGDFGVPPTDPLDSSAVKNRPKKISRPPSRVNLLMDDVNNSEPSAEPNLPSNTLEKPAGLTPWQTELQKRKVAKPPPPKPVAKKPMMKSPATPEKPPTVTKPPVTSHNMKPVPHVPHPKPQVEPAQPPPPRDSPSPLQPSSVSPVPSSTPKLIPGHASSDPPDESWKEAYETLRNDFMKFKDHVSVLINTLTEDLDRERKHWAGLEVDIDRLKKKVNTPL